jgi:hypothetical protein
MVGAMKRFIVGRLSLPISAQLSNANDPKRVQELATLGRGYFLWGE